MSQFRNVSDETLFVPEATPQTVAPDDLFTVPDGRDDAFEAQPYFSLA